MQRKFNAEETISTYKHLYNRMCYDLLQEQLFQSFGLELSAASIQFETDDSFKLKGMTFAYFNPIDSTIHVNLQDPFFTTCKNDLDRRTKLVFILFHEMYHKVLLHNDRAKERDHNLWNVAADFEVHNMMYLYKECAINNSTSTFTNEFKAIENMLHKCENKNFKPEPDSGEYAFMFDRHYLNNIAEEIYADILNSKKTESKTFTLSLDQMMGDGNNQQQQQSQSDNGSESDDENENQSAGNKKSDKNNKQTEGNNSDNNNNQSGKNQKNNSQSDSNDGESEEHQKVEGKQSGNATGSASGNQVTITKTSYTLPNGRKIESVDIQWPDPDKLPNEYKKSKEARKHDAENSELRRQIMEQNLRNEVERNKGNISADCNEFLKKLFKVKIDWEKILKNSLQTILTKSDYFSWARPRKTTMTLDLPYLPDIIDDTGAYGKIFICVDQSGSMSDEEFQKIGNIILDAKEHYKKIVVIQHDSSINNVFEFNDINEDTLKHVFTRTSCGGTSHRDVFEYIADDWAKTRFDDENKISAMIVCSDCCSDIQSEQDQLDAEIPRIYLVPANATEYTKGIRGQIIEVE